MNSLISHKFAPQIHYQINKHLPPSSIPLYPSHSSPSTILKTLTQPTPLTSPLRLLPKQNLTSPTLIIIMIITTLRQYQSILIKSLLPFSKIHTVKYSPPPSQLEEFKKLLAAIDQPDSRKEAASLMARLQSDEEIYKEKLLEVEKQFQLWQAEHPHVVGVFEKSCELHQMVGNQTTENKEIEQRCFKEIDNIKVYGITRIAKEAIETLDHLKQAFKIVDDSSVETRIMQMGKLKQSIAQFASLLQKYEIKQFDPLNEPFNPNEMESIGQVPTEDPQKKNRVAKVQRTGFKIKQRLLRSAFVLIYI